MVLLTVISSVTGVLVSLVMCELHVYGFLFHPHGGFKSTVLCEAYSVMIQFDPVSLAAG